MAWEHVRIDRIAQYGGFEAYDLCLSPREMERIERYLIPAEGTAYDIWEAITRGRKNDPGKWICTSRIIKAFRQVGRGPGRLAAFLDFVDRNENEHGFISANQIATFFRPDLAQAGNVQTAVRETQPTS